MMTFVEYQPVQVLDGTTIIKKNKAFSSLSDQRYCVKQGRKCKFHKLEYHKIQVAMNNQRDIVALGCDTSVDLPNKNVQTEP